MIKYLYKEFFYLHNLYFFKRKRKNMKYTEYKEVKQHGSPAFPIQYYYVDEAYPHYEMPLHWHSEFEIIRVKQGRLHLYLNNCEHILESGNMAFIGSGTLHRAYPVGCVYECAVFDLKLVVGQSGARVAELLRPILSAEAEIDPNCPAAEGAAGQLLDAVIDQSPYYELEVVSLVARIFYLLYESGCVWTQPHESKRFTHRRAILTLMIDKIEREYTTKITLGDLAAIAQINEKYLCRFFKEFTGQTPIDYINRLRVDRACYEMNVNRLNVTEAAYECGFNELSYFSKIFKKYKGMTPGQYRSQFAQTEKRREI